MVGNPFLGVLPLSKPVKPAKNPVNLDYIVIAKTPNFSQSQVFFRLTRK
jgi:hypothetical protein